MYEFTCCLPEKFTLEPGSWDDYRALEPFHYMPGRPATIHSIWKVRYAQRTVAVAVVSYPVPSHPLRRRALSISCSRKDELVFANRHIRTISRVIVHPQFRSLGLASRLVRWVCRHTDVRYIESSAVMARAHPFFERAGMTRIEPDRADQPVYFIFDRTSLQPQKGAHEKPRRAGATQAARRQTRTSPLAAGAPGSVDARQRAVPGT